MGSWKRPALAGAGLVSLVSALAVSWTPAAAKGGTDPSHPYRHGTIYTKDTPRKAQAGFASTNDLSFGGGLNGVGVTTGAPRVYAVFWGTQWGTESTDANGNANFSGDPSGMAPDYQAFMKGLGTGGETWSGVMTQYCEGVAVGAQTCPANSSHVGYPTGGALAGVWYDNSGPAPQQASGNGLAKEAIAAAGHFGNTTAALNRNAQYVVISPTGTNPDGYNTLFSNWCAWHDYNGDTTLSGGAASSPYGDVAFTNLPYIPDTGASCGAGFNGLGPNAGITIVGGHEYAETITDQFPAGGWTDSSGAENGDKCAWISSGQGAAQNITLTTGSFAVQSTWANDFNSGSGGCEVSHTIVTNTSADFSISASPASQTVTAGASPTYNVSTAITSGTATTVSLSASGLPSGASASFSPTSVTAGGSSTMTVTTSATTPGGTYTITITGNNGTNSHSTTAGLTVNAAPNDFSIGVSPSSQTVAAGGSTTYTVNTTLTSGSATAAVSLSASGLPAGAGASFNPTSVNPGGSSTMTVTTTTSTPTGSYTITVTGNNGSTSHSATTGLTVSAFANPVVNGGFETGSLSGWTTSGASEHVSSTVAHSGTYSARLGSTNRSNGTSSISQTFTIPSGATTLSFWWYGHCPDTVSQAWASATLHDNTSGTTYTLLPNTCTNTGTWAQVTFSVSSLGGHSVTLTLSSRDDNDRADANYTYFDDVSVS